MSYNRDWASSGNNEDNNNDPVDYNIHQGTIFAIHLTPTMYPKLPIILHMILKNIQYKVRSLPNTGFGVYLFNCSPASTATITVKDEFESKLSSTPTSYGGSTGRPGIYPIFKLNDLNSEQLKTLNTLIEESQIKDDLTGEYPKSLDKVFNLLEEDPVPNYGGQLINMLNQCYDDFTYIPKFVKPYTSRKVALFTDCGKPFNGDTGIRMTLDTIIKDLNEHKIGIDPYLLPSTPETTFDSSEFNILLQTGVDDEQGVRFQKSIRQIDLNTVEDRITRSNEVRRKAFECPLVVNDQLTISTKGLAIFNEIKLKHASNFYDDHGQYRYVETKTVKVDPRTGEALKPGSTTKVVKVGDQCFSLDPKYFDKVLRFDGSEMPSLRIIGFRKLEYFNPSYTVGTPTLMVPDEDGEYMNSRRAFSALYQSLTKSRKMALVWGMTRLTSQASFYYLIPTDEQLGYKTTTNNYPQGLAVIQIPAKDYIRCLPSYLAEKVETVPDIEPNLFDNLLYHLKGQFRNYENPQLDYTFKVFEDFILQKEIKQEESMEGLPDALKKQLSINETESLKKRCMEVRELIAKSKPMTEAMAGINSELNRVSNYQEMNPTAETPAAKKQKILTDDIVLKAWKLSKLNEFSSDQLKVFINSKNGLIEKGRTKAVMIGNISEYLARNVDER